MAISSSVNWELRTTGNDANGGGFKAGASGTDRSQQDSPQVGIDNTAIVCSTPSASSNTLTFVSGYTPSSADVGNVVKITGGTNVNTGWYEITAVSVGSKTWTLAGAANLTTGSGAGSAITGNMGGALASVSAVESAAVNGNGCWVKAGTYSFVVGSTGTRGGQTANWYEGYQTTRGDLGTRPVWQATAGSVTLFTYSASFNTLYQFRNIAFDGNSQSSSHAFGGGNSYASHVAACSFSGFSGQIFNFGFAAATLVEDCSFNGAAGGAINGSNANPILYMTGCEIYGFTQTPLYLIGSVTRTIFRDCSGSSTDGVTLTQTQTGSGIVESCTFKNIGRYGVSTLNSPGNAETMCIRNCLFSVTNASSYGIGIAQVERNVYVFNCAFYVSGGAGDISGTPYAAVGKVTLTADPFVNSSGNNLALNSVAGGGAACKAVAAPGVFPSGLSASYLDIGAVQSAGSGGGLIRVGTDGGFGG